MEEEKKMGFFKRVKTAVFNLEDYKIFVNEKFSKAFKYLMLLVLMVTIILSITTTINIKNQISRLFTFIEKDFPEFSYSDGKLDVPEKVNAYDEEFNSRLIVDTSPEVTDETLEQYKKDSRNSDYAVIMLQDKVYFVIDGITIEDTESSYTNILGSMANTDITKKDLLDKYINESNMPKIIVVVWIYTFIFLFFVYLFTFLEDMLIVAVFGWLAAKISRASLTLGKSFSLAIYSITLSIILNVIYVIASQFTGFSIKYFELMYMIIAYIYMIAAILILKVDLNKTAGEAIPIKVQPDKKEKKEEIPEDTEDKKEKEEEEKEKPKSEKKKKDKKDKEETNINTEPKGSEI